LEYHSLMRSRAECRFLVTEVYSMAEHLFLVSEVYSDGGASVSSL